MSLIEEILDEVFGAEMSAHFANELLDMWTGRMLYQCEGINYTLTGQAIEDGNAFVVSVKNRTVITAVDAQSMREQVFTNIDSAVLA